MKFLLFEYPFAEDWRKWDCIAFEVNIPKQSIVELCLNVYPLGVGRPEYIEKTSAWVTVAGEGWQKIEIAFSQFDYKHGAAAFWRFIKKAELSIDGIPEGAIHEPVVRNIRLKHSGILHAEAPVYSRSGGKNEAVSYDFTVTNNGELYQALSLNIEKLGWESMSSEIIPNKLVLEPYQCQKCILKVNIGENVAVGGFEYQKVVITPNGNSNYKKELEFITVCTLPHPYILHDAEGWQEVSEKVERYPWAKEALTRYVKTAEEWEVPMPNGGSYAFELSELGKIEALSLAWKLTGKKEFGNKIAVFMKRLADPVKGYPATSFSIFHSIPVPEEFNNESTMLPKICSGGLIHEGEFLMGVAAAYDLIYDEGLLENADKKLIEKALRIFIGKVDWAITDGDCNNIPSGAMAAALFCSLVIQDMHWVQRFIYGENGVLNFLGTTILDDGWYFEGASNYVLLGAHIYSRIAQALLPWGINLKDAYIPAKYSKNIMLSPWSYKTEKPFLGMNFERQGPVTKNCHSIADFWDGLLPFVDYRGILFAISDSGEKDISALYEMAYSMYRKPEYTTVIKNSGKRDLLYGVPQLPDIEDKPFTVSTCADNVGIALLRSQKKGRQQREQIQMVLRYGTHGGYHGHFDKTDMVSLMRYGKMVYSPHVSWYGYGVYLFKMWVQNSISHNMITVDQKMQEPAIARRLMFYSGEHIQSCAVETTARWSDPPYGGQTPYPENFPQEKSWKEGRYIPLPVIPRKQGDIGEYTESVKQRRLAVVTDDYIVLADWIKADHPHCYDNWLHLSGFIGITASHFEHVKHTGKLNEDPFGGGQFITDCNWYNVQAPAVMSFGYAYDREQDSPKVFTLFNENGYMNVDVHSLWPQNSQIIIGNHPEKLPVNKRLTYQIIGDSMVLADGKFGAWILGKDSIRVNIQGMSQLEIKVWVQMDRNTLKTLFLGDPFILTECGKKIFLSELAIEKNNVLDNADSKDYYGGPVRLEGIGYEKAVGIEPHNIDEPSSIVIDLSKIEGAAEFNTVIGGDYPAGNEDSHRKAMSIRVQGEEAKYITLLELHENKKMIKNAIAVDENTIKVELKDGRTQEITFKNFYTENDKISVCLRETLNDSEVIYEER